jgi:hypothetical protein
MQDCVTAHDSYINKFANNTVVGLITDESTYKEVVSDLAVWCQDNNLNKTKAMIVHYRRKRGEHAPINDGAVVEWVESFKFLGVHITKDLRKDSYEEGKAAPLPPRAEKFWHGPLDASTAAPARES